MEAAIDFKSLRAKFQEGSQLRNRPAVLDKPRHFPPVTSRANFVLNSVVEEKNLSTPPLNLRDDQKLLSGKQPPAAPSGYFPPGANGIGSGVAKRSLKDRQFPLVLPSSSSSTSPKQDAASSFCKLVTSPIKCKKKAMPMPFKPVKFAKSIKDILENAEHPENSKSQSERSTVENGISHHNGGSNSGSSCPSPEQPLTPSPTTEEPSSWGSVPHVLSTLERAKKKFSPKNLLVYTRPKSFYSSKGRNESSAPSVEYENLQCGAESSSLCSVYQPLISPTCTVQDQPEVDDVTHKPGPVVHLNGDMNPVRPGSHIPPLFKALPDMSSLGSLPKKPQRPPHVDLSSFRTQMLEAMTEKLSMKLAPGSVSAAAANTLVPPPPQFDAHHYPDVTTSVLETLNTNEVQPPPLEMKATNPDTPPAGAEESSDANLHNDAIQKHVPDSREPRDYNLLGSIFGHVVDPQVVTTLEAQLHEATPDEFCHPNILTDSFIGSEPASEPSIIQRDDHYEDCDNVYEEVEATSKFNLGQNSRKWKVAPKNPYAEALGETRRSTWHVSRWMSVTSETSGVSPAHWESAVSSKKEHWSPDHHEEKELRKREKQRLEREKKEQKEKEKKENEMKKKFKITGDEEPMYHARVLLAGKPRKHDLQVKSGDTVSIIRTTNCPKGKWLARDLQNKYGYISVMNVELNMKEMLELGKRASQAVGKGPVEADTVSLSSRSSYYNPVLTSSFTDDSEEWTCDEETLSYLTENMCPDRAISMPDVFQVIARNHHVTSGGTVQDIPSQVNHEALQKLAVFFQNTKDELNTETEITDPITPNMDIAGLPVEELCEVEEPPYVEEDLFSFIDVELLPPPELYADDV